MSAKDVETSSRASSRRSEGTTASVYSVTTDSTGTYIPWLERQNETQAKESTTSSNSSISIDVNVKPGQYVLQTLFAEFTVQAQVKIEKIMTDAQNESLSKSLQRGGDEKFDQLLSSLSAVAEHCLPSLLKTLFDWYKMQSEEEGSSSQGSAKSKEEKDYVSERRDLAVDGVFCLVLIEVLKQLARHPVPEEMVKNVEDLAFKHFKPREESVQPDPNRENFQFIADLYAEVLGVLALDSFISVRRRFASELKGLRSEPQTEHNTKAIISLIKGLKFYRVKMYPVEAFENSFMLLHECANYYLEVKDKSIKYALAGLLVEILIPVAAKVNNEVNIPVLKNFVDKLYQRTIDQCPKRKKALDIFPLITCLLCVSQKEFFLNKWYTFLEKWCFQELKNKNPVYSRVALESLYRLLWVYVIRIKCESNNQTNQKLSGIVNALFPRNDRKVVPRDTHLNIFVKIVQFIAQERLEYAVKEIIYDLMGVNNRNRVLYPERINIGLRAFLVIADSRQQKEGAPPMPATTRIMPSGSTLRVRKTFLSKQLTNDAAKSIGVDGIFASIKKALENIIRQLDTTVGKTLLMTNAQSKEVDDILTPDRKPKIELFRTCVVAIPRIIPDGMSRKDLLELLCRLTVHRDDELRTLAGTSLQTIVVDLAEWRDDVLSCFTTFILKEVHDTVPLILENSVRTLLNFVQHWKNAVSSQEDKLPAHPPYERNPSAYTLNMVEGVALVFLCSCRPLVRRVSYSLLKEIRALFGIMGYSRMDDDPVIDVLDRACPGIVESFINQLPPGEKAMIISLQTMDLHWVLERSITQWSGSTYEASTSDSLSKLASRGMGGFDPWITCIARFFGKNCLPHYCPSAVSHAWPAVFTRLTQLNSQIDPNAPSEGRMPHIRPRKIMYPMDDNQALWKNYLVCGCSCAPASAGYQTPSRCLSPEPSNSGATSVDTLQPPSQFSLGLDKVQYTSTSVSAATLFKQLVPLLKCENTDAREAAINGLSWSNVASFRDLMDELQPFMKEATERKQENMRRKRRRDFLRVHLIRLFELLADHGLLRDCCSCTVIKDCATLHQTFISYVDGMRQVLDAEGDKDSPTLVEIRLHYSGFIHRLIRNLPVENRSQFLPNKVRHSAFHLCSSWCHTLGMTYGAVDRNPPFTDEPPTISDLELEAVQAMGSLLVCGEVFDAHSLCHEGQIYSWLNKLLKCKGDERIAKLGRETVKLLLENNSHLPEVLEMAISKCYTESKPVADGYFQAIASILADGVYPCDLIPTICVVLMKTGDADTTISSIALRLLQVLDRRFFPDNSTEVCLEPTHGKSHKTLAQELARLHPEITLWMFNEITMRFESTTEMAGHLDSSPTMSRKILLEILIPWLYNIELVDCDVENEAQINMGLGRDDLAEDQDVGCPQRKTGWGSKQATQVVLNNLLSITQEYGDDYPVEIESVWVGLCTCWSNNMRVILNYLLQFTAIILNPDLLPYLKRIVRYIARAKTNELMELLMKEIQSVEVVNYQVERLEEPPYFSIIDRSSLPHSESVSSLDTIDKDHPEQMHVRAPSGDSQSGFERRGSSDVHQDSVASSKGSDKGVKTDGLAKSENFSHHQSTSSLTTTLTSSSSTPSSEIAAILDRSKPQLPILQEVDLSSKSEQQLLDDDDLDGVGNDDSFLLWRQESKDGLVAVRIPLPVDIHCGNLSDLIENHDIPQGILHRCNLAVMLLTDLVVEQLHLNLGNHYLPIILHTVFLGMDHSWPLVYLHCKQLLLNLMVILSPHGDHAGVARMLLRNHSVSDLNILFEQSPQNTKVFNFTGAPTPILIHPSESPGESTDTSPLDSVANVMGASTLSLSSSGSVSTVVPSSGGGSTNFINGEIRSEEDAAKALMEFLVSRKSRPLWSSEEITPRCLSIKSAEQMSTFLQHVVRIFQSGHRGGFLEQRWAEIALQPALQGSSRHYAGRSFQIFRALNPTLSSNWLSDILRRLVETVTEQGNETQGYVSEILLTLENSIDTLAADLVFSEPRERNKSTAGRKSDYRKSTSSLYMMSSGMYDGVSKTRHPTPSMNITDVGSTTPTSPPLVTSASHADLRSYGDHRGRSASAVDIEKPSRFHGSRSRSSQSLRNLCDPNVEEKLNILVPLFWTFVSLLESDNEFEFYLALRSLDKLLKVLPLDRPEVKKKLEENLEKLDWKQFPGIQGLVLKGFTSAITIDLAQVLISKLTLHSHLTIVDPFKAAGFPLNVVALLPYLIQHYDQPDKMAIEITYNIGKVCQNDRHSRIAQLADVLRMYREKTYNKKCSSWVGVVCKYLHEVYSQYSIAMMTFLIEVLEKGPSQHQGSVLQIIDRMLYNVDLMAAPMQQVNNNLLRIITKYVHGKYWSDSLEILKTAVKKTSTIVIPETKRRGMSMDASVHKKDLPGRTMEFTFDVWKHSMFSEIRATPMISRRVVSMQTLSASMSDDSAQSTMSSDDSSMSTDPTETGDPQSATNNVNCQKIVSSGWRKPELSQKRTRERLLKVFHSLGPGSVDLSRTPSVLFSSTSIDKDTTGGSAEGSGDPISIEPDPQGEGTVDSIFQFLYPEDDPSEDPFAPLYSDKEDREDDEDDAENDAPVDQPDDDDDDTETTKKDDMEPVQSRSLSESSKSSQDDVSVSTLSLAPEHSCFEYIAVDEVEESWRRHADEVVKDTFGHEAVQTFHVFAHLYNVMQQRFCNLTREGCNYLGDKMRGVAQEFLKTLDLLSKHTVCPFVFVDTEVLIDGGLLQSHQHTVMELDQHYDTYITKRDSTHTCLDDIKSSLKRQSVASQDVIHINSQVELCRQLYKLYSQLRMLFDTYCKLVNSMRNTLTAQITDFSDEVAMAKMELRQAAEEVERNIGSFSPDIDASHTKREDARRALRNEMGNRSFTSALRMLHVYRSMWTGHMFGSGEEDDEDILLHLFCEHLAEGKTGVIAISMSADELAGICSRLREVNMQLMTATKGVEMLEIQEVTEKHESEPYEGEEEYGKGMKHLKGSRESLPERGEEPDGTQQPSPPTESPKAATGDDIIGYAGSESVDRQTPTMELQGATLTSSLDHKSSSKIGHALIVYASSEDEQEKDESSVASDDTMKGGSVADEVDFELLASLKEESVDDPEILDLAPDSTLTFGPSTTLYDSQEGDLRLNSLVVPTIEIQADTDNEEGGGEGLSVVADLSVDGQVMIDDGVNPDLGGMSFDEEVITIEDEGDNVPVSSSGAGEAEEEVVWQRFSSSQEADILDCTDL
ncbi:protein furry homolog-like isoform X4 [Apostichopus japonicus]|uniref:protein furry homolog-like isoform X4 n=1 Tax=Stichopus japonicus TaxID=307972 RepID=UPI003AB353B3